MTIGIWLYDPSTGTHIRYEVVDIDLVQFCAWAAERRSIAA